MTLFEKQWVKSPKQQEILAQQIENHLVFLRKKLIKVSIASPYPPVRSEWEIAFIRQTGFSLPIEPGTKLVWLSTMTGETKVYTTVYDTTPTQSSGTIYPYLEDETFPPIRHLGVYRDGVFNNIYNKVSHLSSYQPPSVGYPLATEGRHMAYNPELTRQQGLEALLFMMSFTTGEPNAAVSLRVRFAGNYDLHRHTFVANSEAAHTVTTHWNSGAPSTTIAGTLPTADYAVQVDITPATNWNITAINNRQPATTLIMYLSGLSNLTDPTTGLSVVNPSGPSGWIAVTGAVDNTNSIFAYDTFQLISKDAGQYSPFPSFYRTNELAGSEVTNSMNGNVYGIYNKETLSELEDGIRWLSHD